MKNIEKSLKKLGFSDTEVSVLLALLRLKRAKVTAISAAADVPRTSAFEAIKSLHERELITKVRVNNHNEWEALPPKKLTQQIQHALRSVKEALPELEKIYEGATGNYSNAIIKVYETRAGLMHAYDEILKLKRGERVYSIEGVQSIVMKSSVMPRGYFVDWQEKFKKKGLILDAIASEEVLPTLEKMSDAEKKAHLGRSVAATIFPKGTLAFAGDLLIFRNSVLITLPKKKTAVYIKSADIAEMFRHLHGIIRGFGKTFDLNQWFRESLEK